MDRGRDLSDTEMKSKNKRKEFEDESSVGKAVAMDGEVLRSRWIKVTASDEKEGNHKHDANGALAADRNKQERNIEGARGRERRYSERSKEDGGRGVSERDSLASDRNKEDKHLEGGREREGMGGGKGGSGYSERDRGKEKSPCWC